MKGFYWITVSTPLWQRWMNQALYTRRPGDPKSIAIPAEAQFDKDLITQWMNEGPDEKRLQTGHETTQWVVINEMIPVDLRDAARYGRCAAELFVNTKWERVPAKRPNIVTPKPRQRPPQENLATEPVAATGERQDRSWIRQTNRNFIRGSQ